MTLLKAGEFLSKDNFNDTIMLLTKLKKIFIVRSWYLYRHHQYFDNNTLFSFFNSYESLLNSERRKKEVERGIEALKTTIRIKKFDF